MSTNSLPFLLKVKRASFCFPFYSNIIWPPTLKDLEHEQFVWIFVIFPGHCPCLSIHHAAVCDVMDYWWPILTPEPLSTYNFSSHFLYFVLMCVYLMYVGLVLLVQFSKKHSHVIVKCLKYLRQKLSNVSSPIYFNIMLPGPCSHIQQI